MIASKHIEVLPGFQLATLPRPNPPMTLPVRIVRLLFSTIGRLFPVVAGRMAYYLFTRPRIRAVHRSTDEVLEQARLFEVLYGKIILKAYEWGSGSRTVLLVHGWESRGTALRSFVPDLVAAGFRVIAFDGPAHGNSGGKRTNLPYFAGAVRAVVNQTGPVHALITHSFGGPTSVYAMTHLDLSISIEKLVLIAVPASTREVVEDAIRIMNVPPRAARQFRKLLGEKIKGRPLQAADLEYSLADMKVGKVLVVHDKLDEAVSFDSAERLYEKYDHVDLLVTRGLGHYRLMKDETVVQRVTDFVNGFHAD